MSHDSPATPAALAAEHLRRAAALLLWDCDAVQVRPEAPFRLASGNHSPIYVNCRRAISEPSLVEVFSAAARVLLDLPSGPGAAETGSALMGLGGLAGGETAGIPFAAFLARSLALPMVYVRKKPKGYGLGTRVEGVVVPGSRVLLVEDLITDGGSKLGFLEALSEAGAEVRDALVLFDRQQGGAATLAERGVRLQAVTDRATALEVGEEAGRLDAVARESVDAYFENAEGWHRERGLPFNG